MLQSDLTMLLCPLRLKLYFSGRSCERQSSGPQLVLKTEFFNSIERL